MIKRAEFRDLRDQSDRSITLAFALHNDTSHQCVGRWFRATAAVLLKSEQVVIAEVLVEWLWWKSLVEGFCESVLVEEQRFSAASDLSREAAKE